MRRFQMIFFTLIASVAVQRAHAQSNPTYIQFAPPAVKGALYKPDPPCRPPGWASWSCIALERYGQSCMH